MWERKKNVFRREPVERAHGEVVVLSVPNGELLLEVLKGIKLMRSIEVFVIFPVAALDLAVMPGSVGFNEFVANTEFPQRSFK